jgi:hypothetical protein
VVWSQDYSKSLKTIKGIVPYGTKEEDMKHFIIDQSGKAIMQGKNDKKPKNLFEAEGGNVHCVAKNPSNTYDVAIGSKD